MAFGKTLFSGKGDKKPAGNDSQLYRKKVFSTAPKSTFNLDQAASKDVKSPEEQKTISAAIVENALFQSIASNQQQLLMRVMSKAALEAGQSQEFKSTFCVCTAGAATYAMVETDDGSKKKKDKTKQAPEDLSVGASFGELSLLHENAAPVRVTATDSSVFWYLEGAVFKQVIESSRRTEIAEREKFLRDIPILKLFSPSERVQLAGALTLHKFEKGKVIIEEGTAGNTFYFLQKGECQVSTKAKGDVDYKYPGSYFGEKALMENEPRNATITAKTYVEMLVLAREDFQNIFEMEDILSRGNYDTMDQIDFGKLVIGGCPLLATLTEDDRQTLAKNLVMEEFEPKAEIFKEGAEGDKLYIVQQGEVTVSTSLRGVIDLKVPGEFFGERALLDNAPRMATVIAGSDNTGFSEKVKLLSVGKEQFDEIFGGDALDFMGRRREVEDTRDVGLLHVASQPLGKGAFGTVYVVKQAKTDKVYALKQIRKDFVRKHQYEAAITREKSILQEIIPHPNIITLYNSFQDDQHLYMLMQLALGGELYLFLTKKGKFSVDYTKFYSACVVSAMAHLHRQNIIYRDLKPENLIIDGEGYIKLIDMGFARKLSSGQAYTLCGTPYYLSPEMIKHTGYDKGTDWWTVGVLIYEMIAGHPPFLGNNELEVYAKVTAGRPTYGSNFKDQTLVDLIAALLKLDPAKRLGNTKGGPEEIKAHNFFKGLSYQDLEERKIPAPEIVKTESTKDMFSKNPKSLQDTMQNWRSW